MAGQESRATKRGDTPHTIFVCCRRSVQALGRWEGLHLVRECVKVHWPVAETHLAVAVPPAEGVPEPVAVIALGEVLARVRAAALGAVQRRMQHDRRLPDEIVELQRL